MPNLSSVSVRHIDKTQVNDTLVSYGFKFTAMASPCEIRIGIDQESRAKEIANLAITEVRRIEAKYSRYQANSMISQVNQRAGTGKATLVDEETVALLNFCQRLYDSSDGLFDITSGILRQVWDFKQNQLPSPEDIKKLLPLIGWYQVKWQDGCITLPQAGMEIDFGGIGKEYAVDKACVLLQDHGVTHGFVNLGGDFRALGPQLDGSPWQVGIAAPRQNDAVPVDPSHTATIAQIAVSEGAVATSGDYERFMMVDGKRYCHILNPKTGYPVAYWQSVSVLSSMALMAGGLATVAMLKEQQALDFLQMMDASYFLIDGDGQILHHRS